MLVLSRKIDDEIVIGDDVTVRILRVKGNTVRIGVSAPADVSIMRGELPRREVEFEVPLRVEAEDEQETEIRFQRYAPIPPKRNRLAELARKVTQDEQS